MKKIISITIWAVIITGLFVLVSFIEAEHKKTICKSFEVTIDYKNCDQLITPEKITKKVYKSFDTLLGKKLTSINSVLIEDEVNKFDFVENADVFTTLTGKMKIHVVQRQPVLRVQNSSNQSYYLDRSGEAMPMSRGNSSRILVASGNIRERYSDSLKVDFFNQNSTLTKLHKLALYINETEFLKAQIEQIYVTKNKDFELVPKVGRQLIIFGDINNMEQKFDKLIVFYKEGMSRSGWDKYNKINLEYNNQVICSKR